MVCCPAVERSGSIASLVRHSEPLSLVSKSLGRSDLPPAPQSAVTRGGGTAVNDPALLRVLITVDLPEIPYVPPLLRKPFFSIKNSLGGNVRID